MLNLIAEVSGGEHSKSRPRNERARREVGRGPKRAMSPRQLGCAAEVVRGTTLGVVG